MAAWQRVHVQRISITARAVLYSVGRSLVPTPRAPPGVSPRERVGSGDETRSVGR